MILIIDDDAIVRSSLSLLLKRAGYETEAVASPEAALEFIRQMSPDLIFFIDNERRRRIRIITKSTGVLSESAGDTDHRMGFHIACCTRNESRGF